MNKPKPTKIKQEIKDLLLEQRVEVVKEFLGKTVYLVVVENGLKEGS